MNVPLKVQQNARRGLALRRQWGRGGTEVGEATAKKLASGKVSQELVAHISEYFPRHAGDRLEADGSDGKAPSNGYIAWLLWGGDEGRKWSSRKKNPMKSTYEISIIPAGPTAVRVTVYRDGATRLDKTLKGASAPAAAEAAKKLVQAELQSPAINWRKDGWAMFSAKLQHREFESVHQSSGRMPNSPFITFPSRDMAEQFAKAAKAAGHSSVLVSTFRSKPGVMLGNMTHKEANELVAELNRRFPGAVTKANPRLKAKKNPEGQSKVWGFIDPKGKVIKGSYLEKHHVYLALKLGLKGKMDAIKQGYIAFDVRPSGWAEFIGYENDEGFRRRVMNAIKVWPEVTAGVEWYFEYGGGADSADSVREALIKLKAQANPYMGFKKLTSALRRKGVQDPAALAASIGRKKYGKKAFQEMAAAGRRAARRNPEDLSNVYLRQVSWGDSNIQWDIISPEYGKIGQVDVINYRYKLGDTDSALLDVSTEENENVPKSLIKGWTKEGPQYVLGPGVARRLLQEVKRDVKRRFPNVKTLVGERTTGAKPGKVARIQNPFEGAWKTMASKKKATKRAKNPVQQSGGIRTVGA